MLGGFLDLGVVERDLVVHPLVVDVGAVEAQHDVLHPVGERPAGGVTRLDADAPRRDAVVLHLVLEGDQLVPGLGDLVAVLLEDRRRVPHEALHVALDRDAEHVAVDGHELGQVAGRSRPSPLPARSAVSGDDAVGEVLHQARLRGEEDVGQGVAAGFGGGADLGLGVAACP